MKEVIFGPITTATFTQRGLNINKSDELSDPPGPTFLLQHNRLIPCVKLMSTWWFNNKYTSEKKIVQIQNYLHFNSVERRL